MLKKWIMLSLIALAAPAFAQSPGPDTFTFGPIPLGDGYTNCSNMTTLDGQQPNQLIGFEGTICLSLNAFVFGGIITPQSWNYPNNGFGTQNAPFVYGLPNYNDPEWEGGTNYTISGEMDMTGFFAGVVVKVDIHYHTHVVRSCGRTGCHDRTVAVLDGGTGSVAIPQ